jgi:D-aspartate ligase
MLGKVTPATDQHMIPRLDIAYPALILKASRGAIHHGALAVARTLGRLGVPVYAVVYDGCTPLASSRYLTKAFVWESWPNDPESFLKSMSAIAEVIARPTIIIPMDDLSAIFVAENAASLARWFLVPSVPSQIPRRLANKDSLRALCNEIGTPFARSIVPHSMEDVLAFAKGTKFPIVVKATEQWLLLNDRHNVKVVKTLEELFGLYEQLNIEARRHLILQEFIPGDDWVSHGYYNLEKNIVITFTGRKLLDYPAAAGSTVQGLSLGNETLRCESERFLRAVGYSGIIDIDWRKDERDGQYKILDCNPRVGQNFRMFENSAGVDVVRAQHLDLSGRRIEGAAMFEDRLFTVESFYILRLLRNLPRSAMMLGSSRYPFKVSELAWWTCDDPLPSVIMSMRLVLQIIARAFLYLSGIATLRKSIQR